LAVGFPCYSLFRNVLRTLHCNTCRTSAGNRQIFPDLFPVNGKTWRKQLFPGGTEPKATARTAEERQKGEGKQTVQLRPEVEANGALIREGARHGWADKARPSRVSKHRKTGGRVASCAKSGMARTSSVKHTGARRSQALISVLGISNLRKNWAVGAVRKPSQDLAP
jgi:hypothetical protein